MHKLILKLFDFLENLCDILKIFIILLISMLGLYWIQSTTNSNWNWFSFIKSILDNVISFTENFNILSMDTMFNTLLFLIVNIFVLKFIKSYVIDFIKNIYESLFTSYKKMEEKELNKELIKSIQNEELKKNKYIVAIKTTAKEKNLYNDNSINMDEQNKLMIDFIRKKLNVIPEKFEDSFLYYFSNMEDIDNTIEVLFKVLNSKAPIKYAISIQIGNSKKQIKTLIDLDIFGKIILTSETSHRYKFNIRKKYSISEVGIYQTQEGSIQVKEIKNIQ